MQNETKINTILQKLRETGVRISMDDFGTGYRSLNYLEKLQVDILKIDQTFIQNIVKPSLPPCSRSLKVCSCIQLPKEWKPRLCCKEVQGYLFSKPCLKSISNQHILCKPADA